MGDEFNNYVLSQVQHAHLNNSIQLQFPSLISIIFNKIKEKEQEVLQKTKNLKHFSKYFCNSNILDKTGDVSETVQKTLHYQEFYETLMECPANCLCD